MRNRGENRGAGRSKVWLMVLCAAIGLCLLMALTGPAAFREWQLRHTYNAELTMGKPSGAMFYNSGALDRNRDRVRSWIAADLLRKVPVSEIEGRRELRQVEILSRFGTEEDLELLWRKAEIGYPVDPAWTGDPPASRLQEIYCNHLASWTSYACCALGGGEQQGKELFLKGLREHNLAPEMRRTCEGRWAEQPGEEQERPGQ